MKGWSACSLAFAALLASAATAPGELTLAQKKAAETLITQFSAREFAVRQKAVDDLVKIGPDVLPLIRKTVAETEEAESVPSSLRRPRGQYPSGREAGSFVGIELPYRQLSDLPEACLVGRRRAPRLRRT